VQCEFRTEILTLNLPPFFLQFNKNKRHLSSCSSVQRSTDHTTVAIVAIAGIAQPIVLHNIGSCEVTQACRAQSRWVIVSLRHWTCNQEATGSMPGQVAVS